MRSLYKHIVCPSALVQDPPYVITIYRDGNLYGQYGAYDILKTEVSDLIMSLTILDGYSIFESDYWERFLVEVVSREEGILWRLRWDRDAMEFRC